MDWINALVRNKAFWAALLGFANVVLFTAWPTFNKEIWIAFDALAMTIFAAYATRDAKVEVRAMRALRGK